MNEEFNKYWNNTEYRKVIKSCSRSFYGSISKEELDSCEMLGLMRFLKKYDPEKSKWTTFLFICVKNECVNYINKEQRARKRLITNTNVKGLYTNRGFQLVEAIDFMESLNERQRETLIMYSECTNKSKKLRKKLKKEIDSFIG